MPLIRLKKFSSIPSLLNIFIMKKHWSLWNYFTAIKMIIFFLHFIKMVFYTDRFSYVESLALLDKSYFVMVCNPFNIQWIESANILLRNFCICIHKRLGLSYSFLVISWSGFHIGQCWPHWMIWSHCSFFFFFLGRVWKELTLIIH